MSVESLESRSLLATFTVTSAADAGAGTLRNAINSANANSDADTIQFNIGSGARTINLASALPTVQFPTAIDATTQPGFSGKPLIELNGANAGANSNGFNLTGNNITIKGFVINRFAGSGIVIRSGNNGVVQTNFIGTDLGGTFARSNNDGVQILAGSNHRIGGTNTAVANVISGNRRNGVLITAVASTANLVQGNTIGLNQAQTAKVGNAVGILVSQSAMLSEIGGTVIGAGNAIAGNTSSGIVLSGENVRQVQIRRNAIGVAPSNAPAIGNGGDGILLGSNLHSITIGSADGAGNTIGGNALNGVHLEAGGTADQIVLLGNAIGLTRSGYLRGNGGSGVLVNDSAGITIGGSSAFDRNYIIANNQWGVQIIGPGAAAAVQGNWIGRFNPVVLGNERNFQGGIAVLQGASATITDNVISAHTSGTGVGILISDFVTQAIVLRNRIGTNEHGTTAEPNIIGIRATNHSAFQIGSTDPNSGNVIVAADVGIDVSEIPSSGAILHNRIGTGAAGQGDLTPGRIGVRMDHSRVEMGLINTSFGSNAGNLIGGWSQAGILLTNDADGNVIEGNSLGIDIDGIDPIRNGDNIVIADRSSENRVGNNVIANATRFGVLIDDADANLLYTNLIGVSFTGAAAGNGSHGVLITNTTAKTSILKVNRIANNGGDGVLIGSDPAAGFPVLAGRGNRVIDNRIRGNAGKAIDLGPNDGTSPNDAGDADSGPNNLQNFPTITFTLLQGGTVSPTLLVQGTLRSTANRNFLLDFCATSRTDGHVVYLGNRTVRTNTSGETNFSFQFSASEVSANDIFAATATDLLTFDTSEYSAEA